MTRHFPSDKPFSAAAERNREPILDVLRQHFADRRRVLEIGSGTGQHAAHFAQALSPLVWQPTDRDENLDGIRSWCGEAALPNLRMPLTLDVNHPSDWTTLRAACELPDGYDAVYSANTLHIMSWLEVEKMFQCLPTVMSAHARLAIYGPFKLGGQHTSASNAAFDQALRAAVPHRGIRDLETIDRLAIEAGLTLLEDRPLPANNRCVIWQRRNTPTV